MRLTSLSQPSNNFYNFYTSTMSAQAVDLRTIDLDSALKATLIQLCRDHGISHSGLKSQLVHRLYAHRAQLPPPPAATTSATAIAPSTPASSLPPTSHPPVQTATVSTATATTSIVPAAPFVPVAQQLGSQANLTAMSHTGTQVSPAGGTAAAGTSHSANGLPVPPAPLSQLSQLAQPGYTAVTALATSLAAPLPPAPGTSLSAGGTPPPPYVQQIAMQAAQQAAQQAISQVLAQYPQAITAAGPAPSSLPGIFATLPPNLGPPPSGTFAPTLHAPYATLPQAATTLSWVYQPPTATPQQVLAMQSSLATQAPSPPSLPQQRWLVSSLNCCMP